MPIETPRTLVMTILVGARLYFCSRKRTPVGDFQMTVRLARAQEFLACARSGVSAEMLLFLDAEMAKLLGMPPPAKITVEHLNQAFGAANVNEWRLGGGDDKGFEAINGDLADRSKECAQQLRGIKSQYDPEWKTWSYEDGSQNYINAVRNCIASHFPPVVSVSELRTMVCRLLDKARWLTQISSAEDHLAAGRSIELIDAVCEELGIRVPLQPPTSTSSIAEVIEYAREVYRECLANTYSRSPLSNSRLLRPTLLRQISPHHLLLRPRLRAATDSSLKMNSLAVSETTSTNVSLRSLRIKQE